MILKIEYSEENYLTFEAITKEQIEEGYDNPVMFTPDLASKSFFNIIFRVKDKIISYKDKKTGYIYTNNEDSNIWRVNKYDPKTKDVIKLILPQIKETDRIKIETYLKNETDIFG